MKRVFFALLIPAILLTPLSLQQGLQDSPWPIQGHDLRHSGVSEYDTSHNKGGIKWRVETGWIDYPTITPVIDKNGIIYLGTTYLFDGTLYAFYPNGMLKWEFVTEEWIESSPTIAEDGTIYIPSENNLYALNPDGTVKWEFNKGGRWPVIIDDKGIVYLCSDEILYAINPDGTVKWEFEAEDYIANSAAIYNDTIYFADMYGYLYALSLNGTLKWKFDMGAKSLCTPSIDENGIIYCSTNWLGTYNKIYAIYPNGTKKWEWTSPFNPLEGDTHGFAVTNDALYFATYEGKLYALDKENGSMKWYAYLSTEYTPYKYPTLPAIGKDGTIWVACNRYDRESGPDNAYLYAFTSDGEKKYEIKLTSAKPYIHAWPGSPSIAEDGTIYVATQNEWFEDSYGYLYAINEGMERCFYYKTKNTLSLYI